MKKGGIEINETLFLDLKQKTHKLLELRPKTTEQEQHSHGFSDNICLNLQGVKEEMLLYIAHREGEVESSYILSSLDIVRCKAKTPLFFVTDTQSKSHMSNAMSPDRKLLIVWISGWPNVNPALSELASRLLPNGATLSCRLSGLNADQLINDRLQSD